MGRLSDQVDEIFVVVGSCLNGRNSGEFLRQATFASLGVELDPVRGCWTCGSMRHGAPYFSGGWAGSFGCSITYVGGSYIAAISVGRVGQRGEGRHLSIGIDAEDVVSAGWLSRKVVSRILSSAEVERWGSAPPTARSRQALEMWTQKEAVLKAIGCGLGIDPRLVETRNLEGGLGRVCVSASGLSRVFRTRLIQDASFDSSWVVAVATPESSGDENAMVRLIYLSPPT